MPASTARRVCSMKAWRRRFPKTPRGPPVLGENPMLLSNEAPAKVSRASRANSKAYQPALEKIVNFDTNWNIIAYPSLSWAKQVFPEVAEDVAVAKLAEAIFSASRVDQDGAVAAWDKHNAVLRE